MARPYRRPSRGSSIIDNLQIDGRWPAISALRPSTYDSGDGHRSQGNSKAVNWLARVAMVEAAWLRLRHQPDSALGQWFHDRTQGQKGRIRRIMIVALARKLAIALWRYLETGLIPEGASLKSGVR